MVLYLVWLFISPKIFRLVSYKTMKTTRQTTNQLISCSTVVLVKVVLEAVTWGWSVTWPCGSQTHVKSDHQSKHPAFLFTLPPETWSSGLLVWAADEVRLFDKNNSADFKLEIYFCTNNSLSFRDSHDSTAALIQLHHSQKRMVERGRKQWSQEAKKNYLLLLLVSPS